MRRAASTSKRTETTVLLDLLADLFTEMLKSSDRSGVVYLACSDRGNDTRKLHMVVGLNPRTVLGVRMV
jgi:hypothetical protein